MCTLGVRPQLVEKQRGCAGARGSAGQRERVLTRFRAGRPSRAKAAPGPRGGFPPGLQATPSLRGLTWGYVREREAEPSSCKAAVVSDYGLTRMTSLNLDS